jgi:hypothetical protein
MEKDWQFMTEDDAKRMLDEWFKAHRLYFNAPLHFKARDALAKQISALTEPPKKKAKATTD